MGQPTEEQLQNMKDLVNNPAFLKPWQRKIVNKAIKENRLLTEEESLLLHTYLSSAVNVWEGAFPGDSVMVDMRLDIPMRLLQSQYIDDKGEMILSEMISVMQNQIKNIMGQIVLLRLKMATIRKPQFATPVQGASVGMRNPAKALP